MVVSDLTWSELNEALKQLLNTYEAVIETDAYGNPTTLNLALLRGALPISNDDQRALGVVKSMARLFDGCRIAQERANIYKSAGEGMK